LTRQYPFASAIVLVLTRHDRYNNWDTVFTAPPAADVSQYVKSRAGVLAAPSPRLNFWRAYGASDKRTRYAQGTVKPGAGDSLATSQSYNTSQLFTITVYLSQGLTSRGRIGITTTGSMQALVNPWFQDPIDQQVIINAVQDVINESKADSTIKVLVPDLTQMSVSDYVKNYPASNLCSNHWVGSNSIGQVVDANLKVFNTNNLFVVDASIFPALPMGNPHGAIMSAVEQGVANILALSGGP
jgi:cellobiose dehydrogenase (acceptor)